MTAVLSRDIAPDGPQFSRGKSTDCMTFWSTVPGFASFRHEIEGEFTSVHTHAYLQTASRGAS